MIDYPAPKAPTCHASIDKVLPMVLIMVITFTMPLANEGCCLEPYSIKPIIFNSSNWMSLTLRYCPLRSALLLVAMSKEQQMAIDFMGPPGNEMLNG